MKEPVLRVALVENVRTLDVRVTGSAFRLQVDGALVSLLPPGAGGRATWDAGRIRWEGPDDQAFVGLEVSLVPEDFAAGLVTLAGVTVGIRFHWEHREDLAYQGTLSLQTQPSEAPGLCAINVIPLESYLVSVISSEMSALCPPHSMRAHAVVSRSWLWAQLHGRVPPGQAIPSHCEPPSGTGELQRWYDRQDHVGFDVCADDHCQRYQGASRVLTEAASAAVAATRGLFLVHDGFVCDARFSKCCGGRTERFATAWGDYDVPYLADVNDDESSWVDGRPPILAARPRATGGNDGEDLSREDAAEAFILSNAPAFCSTADRSLLARILPAIDHATRRFYRWETTIGQDLVRDLVRQRLDLDSGPVRALVPQSRGASGRIHRLLVEGEKLRVVVGKELEIRRLLSETHLYSSAFVVRPEGLVHGVPARFRLVGAGWGHGVGLCQVGAAVMADRGYDFRTILAHYYRGAGLEKLYA
jgi:peptidoglycan hydrolase-like amidase